MKKSSADEFPGFAPARRSRVWPFFTACFLALGVTCFVLFLPVVMFAMAVLKGLGEMFNSFAAELFFAALSVITPLAMALAELFLLLQNGQYVQFAMQIPGLSERREIIWLTTVSRS